MGDTLTHLPQLSSVEQLFSLAAESLGPKGKFIATFRDYTSPLAGNGRFIPVKSDSDRILTCFLSTLPTMSTSTTCFTSETVLPGACGSAPIGSSGFAGMGSRSNPGSRFFG